MSKSKLMNPLFEVDLDKKRAFILNVNGLCKAEELLEKQLGKDDVSLFSEINWDNLRMRDLRLLLFAGLCSDDPDLTVEQVGKIVDVVGLAKSKDVIAEGVKRAFPQASEAVDKFLSPKTVTKATPETKTEE